MPPTIRKKNLEVLPAREKPLRELLMELANKNTVAAAEAGFNEIDIRAEKAKNYFRNLGIRGVDEAIDGAALAVKRKAAELMTGRPQR